MQRREEGYFASKDGTRLFWRQILPTAEPKAWIGLVHGYGDHCGRYERPIANWIEQGFGVLALDYRGHGKADGRRADCVHWDDYLDDMRAFYSRLVDASRGKSHVIVAHSHGALIATHFATQPLPELKGMVLSAPFYQLAFDPPALKLFGAKLIKGIFPAFHVGNELKAEALSRDPAWQAETKADPLYLRVTTPRWFFEVGDAQRRLTGIGPRISVPVLMLAGTGDQIASMPAAKAFFDTIGSRDKTYRDYVDFRHELMMEIGREQVWADISSWISSHC